jgi:hypothetical protein
MMYRQIFVVAAAIVVAVASFLVIVPAHTAQALPCFVIGRTLPAVIGEQEGQYIGIGDARTHSDTAIRLTMVKTDPRNPKFTNHGQFWVQAVRAGYGNWQDIAGPFSYDGRRQAQQYQATVNLWNAPKRNIQLRFKLFSNNDENRNPKYSNRVAVSNLCF